VPLPRVTRALVAGLLAVALAGSAAAATIRAKPAGGLLRGTASADRIVGGPGPDRIAAAFGGSDRVSCGRGRDIVTADLADRVGADCETVLRRLSVDTFDDPKAQHETAVEPASASFRSTVVSTFQVGRFRDGGADSIGFAVSRDAGRTWQRGLLPGVGRSSDPSVAYDPVHGVWLAASLLVRGNAVSVAVSRSTDARTWSQPIIVNDGPETDKEWISCDGGPASPFRGRCYVVFTDDGSNELVSQSSDDGGLTWGAPVRVAGPLLGAQPVIRPDGSLVVIAVDADHANGPVDAIRSTDGGATFEAPQQIATLQRHQSPGLRQYPLPSAVAASDGTLYAVWHDCRYEPGCSANDLVLATSRDGVTWSGPTRLALEPVGSGIDQFIPGLAVDPASPRRLAVVYASYPDAGCARASCRFDVGLATSTDGGVTWRRPQRLDVESMPLTWIASTNQGRMIGDYLAASFAGGRVVPVFTLAAPPVAGRLHEAIFATSLRAA
jgi:hypothetical protein